MPDPGIQRLLRQGHASPEAQLLTRMWQALEPNTSSHQQANSGKLQKLDELAAEHGRVVRAYVDWLIGHEVRQPNKYADIPPDGGTFRRAYPTVGSGAPGNKPVALSSRGTAMSARS